MLLGMVLLLSCKEPEPAQEPDPPPADSGETDTGPTDTGEPPREGFFGDITITSAALAGRLSIEQAFAMAQDDTLLVYLSSNPDATCERVAAYLTPSDKPDDPSDLRLGQTCDMFLKIRDWDGDFSATDDRIAIASSAISCALGEGTFAYEERGDGYFDYYWSGRWWQGIPDLYTLAIADAGDGGFTIRGEMTSFDGAFIYEKLQSEPGTGEVYGEASITPCAAFEPLFKIY